MASRTGTASQVNASAASGSTSVTVPAGATAAVAFWAHFDAASSTLSTLTLNGVSFTTRSELSDNVPADASGTGVATITTLPAPGSTTLAWAWSAGGARAEGGGLFVVWVKDVNTSDVYRDADTAHATSGGAVAVTIDTAATDLVLALGQAFSGAPVLNAGTLFVNNVTINVEHYDAGEYTAGVSSTTCSIGAPDYSTVAAISLKDGAAPPAVTATTNPIPVRHARETSW